MKEKIKAIEKLREEYTKQSKILIHELARDILTRTRLSEESPGRSTPRTSTTVIPALSESTIRP